MTALLNEPRNIEIPTASQGMALFWGKTCPNLIRLTNYRYKAKEQQVKT
jgi:hypothetical protein